VRLLLDEMLSPVIAARLRAVKGSEHEVLSDPEVMNLARSQRCAVVTNNLVDFRPLHHETIAPCGRGRARRHANPC
jgi:predicted nuclease of predicted toxin-antitoxin system